MRGLKWKQHWLLMMVLGIVVSLAAVGCGSGDMKKEKDKEGGEPEAMMTKPMGEDPAAEPDVEYDEAPPAMYDQAPPDPTGMEPFQTNEGDVGTITLENQPPEWTQIDLSKYTVTGSAPAGSVVNGQLQGQVQVQVQTIVPYVQAPPFGGTLPTTGVTDQPVGVHNVDME